MKRLIAFALLCLVPSVASAQKDKAAADTTPPAPPPPPPRAGWLSDRRYLRIGDLLTVYVSESAQAAERTNATARNRRSQVGTLDFAKAPTDFQRVGIGYDASSDQGGVVNRQGDLDAALTVRVVGIEPGGILKVEGHKIVNVDGRKQDIMLSGVVRPEDIGPTNTLYSTRIGDAMITYKGKKIGPATGLFGKLLAALWP